MTNDIDFKLKRLTAEFSALDIKTFDLSTYTQAKLEDSKSIPELTEGMQVIEEKAQTIIDRLQTLIEQTRAIRNLLTN